LLVPTSSAWPSDGVWPFDPSQAKTFAVSWLGSIIFNSEIPKQVRLFLPLICIPHVDSLSPSQLSITLLLILPLLSTVSTSISNLSSTYSSPSSPE